MVKFRRSLKSVDKTNDSKGLSFDSLRQHHHQSVSIPSKEAPLKVIKALYDYDPPEGQTYQLAFTAGDYLHVVAREHDTEWYEACNPLVGSRGLVPVAFFEQVGKTVRDSRGSGSTRGSGNHDSGYSERSNPSVAIGSAITSPGVTLAKGGPPEILDHFRMSKMAARGAAPVYGVVAYDFKAERPDELDAKEGEAIIVIAQSNPEWFVAKPITRLGGPGLIPVSFIEIKDMQTGQSVSDTAAAVARAGIPRVEEWKKMAAEYKNTSIPLGQIRSSTSSSNPAGAMDALSDSMNRVSMGSQNGRVRSQSSFSQSQSQYPLAPLRASVPRYLYADDKYHFVVEVRLTDNSCWDLTRIYEDFYELQINLIKAFPEEAGNTGHQRILPLMPGPVQFVTDRITEGRRENLDEYLYKLLNLGPHIVNSALVRNFFSPRGNDYECDVSQLLEEHARSAYAPGGDRYNPAVQDRYSAAAQVSVMVPGHGGRGSVSSQRISGYSQQHQRGLSSASSRAPTSQGHYRTPSDATYATSNTGQALAPPMTRNMTQGSTASSSSTIAPTSSSALKVKVWFDRDTCVVLRLPPRGTFSYAELHRKIMERRRLEFNQVDEPEPAQEGDEVANEEAEEERALQKQQRQQEEEEGLWVEYRDEVSGEYLPLANDDDLEQAVGTCEKLTLVVRAAG